MDNEHAVKHLSQSHMFCWRTLAVTLELFPSLYRNCMFQLALVPPGLLVSEALLRELWALGDADLPSVVSMFTAVAMLVPVPGPAGRRWHVSNLAHEYMGYWARMSGKGASVGRLQRWLLTHQVRAA